MSSVLAVCLPVSDVAFGERVRQVVARDRWDLGSPEGIAQLEALLRRTYPRVTVVLQGGVRAGGVRRMVVLDVHRDGMADMTPPEMRWLEAVYELTGAVAYREAARVVGDGPLAEQVVEQAFAEVRHASADGVSVEAGGTMVQVATRRLANDARIDARIGADPPGEAQMYPSAPTTADASLRIGGVRRTLSARALSRLGAAQRAAVELAVLEGLKVGQIAERMQTSPVIVNRHLKDALLAAGSDVVPTASTTLGRWRDAQRRWARLPVHHAARPECAREVAYAWLDYQVATRAGSPGSVILVTDAERRFVASDASAGTLLNRPSVVGLRIDDITADYARPLVSGLWTVFDENGSMDGDYDCDRPDNAPLRVAFQGVWGRPLPDLQVGYLRSQAG